LTVVPPRRREQGKEGKLGAVQALVDADMRQVNRLIVARLDSPVHLISELASHLVAAGGKRVRPMLTLIAAKLCDYRGERHIKLAAAVEFIHSATLLHDDVVDQSDLRRGSATANTIWGNKPSVLVGDFLALQGAPPKRLLSFAAAVISKDHRHSDLAVAEIVAERLAQLGLAGCVVKIVVHQLEGDAEVVAVGLQRGLAQWQGVGDDAADLTGGCEQGRGFGGNDGKVVVDAGVDVVGGDELGDLALGDDGAGVGQDL